MSNQARLVMGQKLLLISEGPKWRGEGEFRHVLSHIMLSNGVKQGGLGSVLKVVSQSRQSDPTNYAMLKHDYVMINRPRL